MSTVRIYHGDCLDVLATLPAASIDACVTDPPYGLEFMGKEWDKLAGDWGRLGDTQPWETRPKGGTDPFQRDTPRYHAGPSMQAWHEAWARAVYRVLKPGAHLFAFGGTRTFHRLACAIEDAGFEIRDSMAWLYGSGFPKSLNLGEGLGTALKPAHEPIVLARKPFRGSVAANVQQHGTGALNIDACRIEGAPRVPGTVNGGDVRTGSGSSLTGSSRSRQMEYASDPPDGRWPANVCLDERAALVLDEQSGELTSGDLQPYTNASQAEYRQFHSEFIDVNRLGDSGGASRFFYVAKPSRDERDQGCEALPLVSPLTVTGRAEGSAGSQHGRAGMTGQSRSNFHPTVKPIELMRWLIKLITPIDGTVIDPFLGSGTTGMACRYELRHFIGIEREAEYIAIAERRIASVAPLFAEPAQVKEADDVPPLVGSLLDLA